MLFGRRLLPVAVAAAVLGGLGGSALAQSGGTPPTGSTPTATAPTAPQNPCSDLSLRCPDLILYRPYDMYYDKVGSQLRLRAGNSIVNVGRGPAQNRGTRIGLDRMYAPQEILKVGGGLRRFDNGGRLVFKFVPGRGSYWKFENAAKFEVWSLDDQGRPLRRVRTGPKLAYCLRDLGKRFSSRISPPRRHFPACNQDRDIRAVTLGTSVGWSDDYPSPYPEQWIDVAGLRGRFIFFQTVDPLNHMWEVNERNNRSPVIKLTLPPRRTSDGRYVPPSSTAAGRRGADLFGY